MPRARTPIGAAALVVAGLALGTGGAAAQDPTPTPTPTPTPEPVKRAAVSLDVSRPVVQLGGRPPRVTLSGALAGPASVRRVRVRVTGRSAAYRRDTVVRTVRTDRAGRFSVTVRPRLNARYRARILPGQGLRGESRRRAVDVFPEIRLAGEAARRRALRLTVRASAPARPAVAGGRTVRLRAGAARRAFFYLRLRGERRYRLVGTGELSRLRCGDDCTRSATLVVRSRRTLRRTTKAGVCFRGVVFRGLGDESPCGAARRRF